MSGHRQFYHEPGAYFAHRMPAGRHEFYSPRSNRNEYGDQVYLSPLSNSGFNHREDDYCGTPRNRVLLNSPDQPLVPRPEGFDPPVNASERFGKFRHDRRRYDQGHPQDRGPAAQFVRSGDDRFMLRDEQCPPRRYVEPRYDQGPDRGYEQFTPRNEQGPPRSRRFVEPDRGYDQFTPRNEQGPPRSGRFVKPDRGYDQFTPRNEQGPPRSRRFVEPDRGYDQFTPRNEQGPPRYGRYVEQVFDQGPDRAYDQFTPRNEQGPRSGRYVEASYDQGPPQFYSSPQSRNNHHTPPRPGNRNARGRGGPFTLTRASRGRDPFHQPSKVPFVDVSAPGPSISSVKSSEIQNAVQELRPVSGHIDGHSGGEEGAKQREVVEPPALERGLSFAPEEPDPNDTASEVPSGSRVCGGLVATDNPTVDIASVPVAEMPTIAEVPSSAADPTPAEVPMSAEAPIPSEVPAPSELSNPAGAPTLDGPPTPESPPALVELPATPSEALNPAEGEVKKIVEESSIVHFTASAAAPAKITKEKKKKKKKNGRKRIGSYRQPYWGTELSPAAIANFMNDWAPPPPDAGGILGRIMKDVRFKRTFRAHQQDDFSVDQQPLTPWEQPNKRHRREWGVGASSFPAHPRDFPPNPVHPSPIPQVPLSRRFKKAKRRLQQQNQQQVVSVVPKGGYPFKPSTGPPKVNFSKKKSAAPSSNTATPVTFTAKANPGDSKKGQKRPAEDDKQQPEAKRALPDKENRPDDNNNAAVRVEVIVPWRKPTKEPKRGDVIDVPLKEAVALLKGSGAWEVTVEKLPFGAVSGWRALAPREKTSLVDDVLKSARLWSPQSKEEIVKMVDLDPRSAEYLDLEQRFLATSVNKNFVVTRIERVQNPYLRGMFLLKKEEIEQRCGEVAVVRLYHGTPRENIESICKGNLDWRMHGLGTGHRWWGHGVSLSPISYYSSHYGDKGRERSMIVCDVIIGSVSSGRGIVIPPLVPGGKPNQRYDTNMKLIPSPQTVVKFDDHEFYPAYVISYNAPEDDSDWLTTYSPYDYYDYGYGYDRNPFDYNYQVQNSIENYMADNHYKYYWNR